MSELDGRKFMPTVHFTLAMMVLLQLVLLTSQATTRQKRQKPTHAIGNLANPEKSMCTGAPPAEVLPA